MHSVSKPPENICNSWQDGRRPQEQLSPVQTEALETSTNDATVRMSRPQLFTDGVNVCCSVSLLVRLGAVRTFDHSSELINEGLQRSKEFRIGE